MRVDSSATFRIQLNSDFDFRAAAEIVSYLAELGISHFYSSPSMRAAAGSTHGYDVIDYHVSRDLGGAAGHPRCAALRECALTGDLFNAARVELSRLTARFPVCLLMREELNR